LLLRKNDIGRRSAMREKKVASSLKGKKRDHSKSDQVPNSKRKEKRREFRSEGVSNKCSGGAR